MWLPQSFSHLATHALHLAAISTLMYYLLSIYEICFTSMYVAFFLVQSAIWLFLSPKIIFHYCLCHCRPPCSSVGLALKWLHFLLCSLVVLSFSIHILWHCCYCLYFCTCPFMCFLYLSGLVPCVTPQYTHCWSLSHPLSHPPFSLLCTTWNLGPITRSGHNQLAQHGWSQRPTHSWVPHNYVSPSYGWEGCLSH